MTTADIKDAIIDILEGIAPDEQVSQQYLTDACKRGFPPACERLRDSAP